MSQLFQFIKAIKLTLSAQNKTKFVNWGRLVLALIIPIAIFAALIASANKKENRYGLRYGICLNQMMSSANEHIDVLGIGGSRMMALLKPEEVQKHYQQKFGKSITVYNFGKDWQGPDYDYQLLKDFLASKERTIGQILLILDKQRSDTYHPLAYSVFEDNTISDSLTDVRPNDQLVQSSHFLWTYLARFRDVIFNNKEHDKHYIKRLSKNGQTCYPRDFKIDKKRLQRSQKKYNKRGIRESNFDLEIEKNSLALYYYKKIIELAKQNNIEVKLIRAAALHQARLSDESVAKTERLLGAPVLRIPLSIRHQIVENGYRDGKHLLKPGRDLVLPWLVEQL